MSQRLAAAEPAVNFVVENDVVTQPDHCVAWVAFRECAPDDYIAWLNGVEANLMKPVGRDVFQIDIFTAHPPTVGSREVRKVNAAEVIGIAEQRVTVHFTVHEPATKQMRHRAKLTQPPATRQPPINPGCQLRCTVSAG